MTPSRRAKPILRVVDPGGRELTVPSGGTAPAGSRIAVETPHYRAQIETRGYVSGVAAGSFVDKKSGAKELGFGLDIVDFLLEPAAVDAPIPKGQYEFGPANAFHGNIAKRYVEGPQICTQAKLPKATTYAGDGFAAARLSYRWNVAYPPHVKAGSVWEQLLVFPENERFFLEPPIASPRSPNRRRCSSASTCRAISSIKKERGSTTSTSATTIRRSFPPRSSSPTFPQTLNSSTGATRRGSPAVSSAPIRSTSPTETMARGWRG